MNDRDIELMIENTVDDLNRKTEKLIAASKDCDEEVADKVNTIKDKAVKVLNGVSSKIISLIDSDENEDEIVEAIETVKKKSRELYREALSRINDLKGIETVDEKKNEKTMLDAKQQLRFIIDNAKDEIDDFMERDDVKQAVKKAKDSAVDLPEKARNTLKGWLTPGGDDK